MDDDQLRPDFCRHHSTHAAVASLVNGCALSAGVPGIRLVALVAECLDCVAVSFEKPNEFRPHLLLNYQLIVILLLFEGFLASTETEVVLKVEMTRIRKTSGSIRACFIDDENDYLKTCSYSRRVVVSDSRVVLIFDNVKAGIYCVSLYHDEDDNGQLNTGGLFGLPEEPYGFSNNPRTLFGPPDYDKCTIEVKGNTTITVAL